MSLPLITDPVFYAVSVPAVLLLGISKSGFGAGFGALAVPLMALAVSVPQAAAILGCASRRRCSPASSTSGCC